MILLEWIYNMKKCDTMCNRFYDDLDSEFENNIFVKSHSTRSHILELNGNRITELNATVFQGLVALKFLNLSNNQITTIQEGAFQDLPALTILYLYSNQITTIQPGAFQDLPALYELRLGENKISTIQQGIFQDLPALNKIDLSDNQITTIHEGTFQDLPALTTLFFYSNQITTIQQGAFQDLSALYTLYLDSNQISTIQQGTFQDLPALNEIDLSDNQITTIQEGTFQDLPALTTLNLANNPLDCCDCELKNLKLYFLNNTHLTNTDATCNGTSILVLDFNFTDCSDSMKESKPVTSTNEGTTATLYIVGTVGAFIAIMILVGAVLGTYMIFNRMNLKKKPRIEPLDRINRRQFPAMPLRYGGHSSWN